MLLQVLCKKISIPCGWRKIIFIAKLSYFYIIKFLVMKNKFIIFLFAVLVIHHSSSSQNIAVYPTNWWVGMKHNNIQLMLHSTDTNKIIAVDKLIVNSSSPDLKIKNIHKVENKRYIFLDVEIAANAKPKTVTISLGGIIAGEWNKVLFELKPRRSGNGAAFAQGINSGDLVYLIMPDRFSNGDTTNDKMAGMRDQSLNRNNIYDRHGGDLQGIIQHLDYLQKLGVTALWLTPVIENDEPYRTEHGYSFTDYYKIDPRFGGEKKYKELSNALHKHGMKLVQDAVYNHVGSKNIFFLDPPMKDWFHQWKTYTQTTYRDQPLYDPYASSIDTKIMSDGWFTPAMPDVNQSNPYVANFLIQHAIWCVEEFGVDAWRIDTYIYNDLNFMNRCNEELLKEYPKITMFGETWVHGTAAQSYFAANNINANFKSNLIGVTDFQTLFSGILPALKDSVSWDGGVIKLYNVLSNDFLYKNANNNVIFLDNHDLTRIYSELNEDANKVKMALAWLLTCRGIPEIYYGTEVLMKGIKNPDGWVRLDFPGGWGGDEKNTFTQQGLTDAEKNVLQYTAALANFRKNCTAITNGKLMQYVPQDGLYVYFRYNEKQTVMCVMNTSTQEKKINFSGYEERTKGFTHAKDVISKTVYGNSFSVPAMTMQVFELNP